MELIKLTINGQEIETIAGKTILEAVHESGIDKIPTLCHDNRLEHYTSCYLCVVEAEGINKLLPSCSTKVSSGMKIHTNSAAIRESRRTALGLLMSNHYADCIGPCKNNCPAGVDAQGYIALISAGKFKEALKLVKENNPLPLSICRVCVRDCEEGCRRNYVDDPVAVNSLKRYVADMDALNKWIPEKKERINKKVAIVGSGPAGLTAAYYLTLEGYDCTIFEKFPKLGGMLRYGIPEYRLPKQVLDDEIQWILNLGIDVKTNVEMGKDFNITDLKEQGFDAVFVGVGAHKASKLGLDGEDKVEGIVRGIDFLRDFAMTNPPELHGKIIVVGGGNTAIDAARSALRCGADKVTIVYRRSIKEMPANAEEIEAAQAEGVEIKFLTNPKALVTDNNKVIGVECLQMALEAAKPGERPKPVPVPGSEFVIDCDFIISAIGQAVDTVFSQKDKELALEKWGTVIVNKDTMETNIPGVFAGGDAVTGPLTAISSIGQGKQAALAIMEYIEAGTAKALPKKFYSLKHKLGELSEREFESFEKQQRSKMAELEIIDRVHDFREVELGLSEKQVMEEAERCLECGCSEYFDCRLRQYCDEYQVDVTQYKGETKKYKVDLTHPFIELDPNKCINCGKCVRTCSEVLKVSALGFVYRGFKSIVKPAMEKTLPETNCITCGNCLDVCPTGAIAEQFPFKLMGTMPKEDIETVCNFCSVGCIINFKKIDNDLFYVSNSTENIQNSHNRGFLCGKGRFGHRYLLQKNRVFDAVIKRNDLSNIVSEEEAIKYTAQKFKQIMTEYGRESVAVMASPKLSNEELYLLQKLARVGFENNNIDSFSNMLYGLETHSLDEAFGFTGSTVQMSELDKADVIVVMNSNLSDENLVMELKIKAARKKGAKLILIHSSEIQLTRYADLWIDSRKGTNAVLMNALIKSCVNNEGYDKAYVDKYTSGFDDLMLKVSELQIDDAVNYTGIDRDNFNHFAEIMSSRELNIVFVYNLDSTNDKSVNDLKAIGNYLLMTGRAGKANNGLLLLREFNNSTGAVQMGAVSGYLPGFVRVNESQAIDELSEKWNINLKGIFRPVDLHKKMKRGEIKGLLIVGEDPMLVKANSKYLSNVEFISLCAPFANNTMEYADVTIPFSTSIEEEGSYTRCDNTVQYGSKVINGPHAAANWQKIRKLAAMFSGQFTYSGIEDIRKEMNEANRFSKDIAQNGNIVTEFLRNFAENNRFKFQLYDIDLSTFDPVKPVLHYPEHFYINAIKKML